MIRKMTNSSMVALCAILIVFVFQSYTHLPGNILTWDVFGYYLYLPALFIYNDIGLSDFSWVEHILATYDSTQTFYQAAAIENGNWVMKYSSGMAILYLPFFVIGHFAAYLFGYSMDGFSLPYQMAINTASITYTVLGLIFLRKLLRELFIDHIVALLLVILAFGTNYYQQNIYNLGMTHNFLFLHYVLILWFTIKWHKNHKKKDAFLLALVIGSATLCRPTELIALLIPFFYGVRSRRDLKEKIDLFLQHKVSLQIIIITLVAIGLIQITYWKIVSDQWIVYSYKNAGEGFDFLRPHVLSFLTSFRKGWFIYTPIMIFSVWGILVGIRQKNKWGVGLLVFAVVNIFILSSWTTWWYATSFGQRAMVQSYPIFILALGFLIHSFWNTILKRRMLLLLFFLLIGFNQFQIWQYNSGIIHGDRMTKTAYFKFFGRTELLSKNDHKYFLVERASGAYEEFEESDQLRKTKTAKIDFEDKLPERVESGAKKIARKLLNKPVVDLNFAIDTVVKRSGKRSFKLDSSVEFSPVLEKPFDWITNLDYAWIRSGTWMYCNKEILPNQVFLITTFTYGDDNYKYRSRDLSEFNLKRGEWNFISMDYMTPEVRSKSDHINVYIWNKGKKELWIDDLQLEVHEPTKIWY